MYGVSITAEGLDPCTVSYCFPPSSSCSSSGSSDVSRPDVCQIAGCSFGCLNRFMRDKEYTWECTSPFDQVPASEWDDASQVNSGLKQCLFSRIPGNYVPCGTNGRMITAFDELDTACAYHECVARNGRDSVKSVSPLREEVVSLCQCPYKILDYILEVEIVSPARSSRKPTNAAPRRHMKPPRGQDATASSRLSARREILQNVEGHLSSHFNKQFCT